MTTQLNNILYIKYVDFKIFSLYHVILPISGTFACTDKICTFFHLLFGYILSFPSGCFVREEMNGKLLRLIPYYSDCKFLISSVMGDKASSKYLYIIGHFRATFIPG